MWGIESVFAMKPPIIECIFTVGIILIVARLLDRINKIYGIRNLTADNADGRG